MNKITRSYIAGLIDGEGYLGILEVKKGNKKQWTLSREIRYVPVLKVASTTKGIITWLYESFGGTMETRKAYGNARESYCWSYKYLQAIEFIKLIYPYLKIKRTQAEILMRFPSGKGGLPMPEEIQKKRQELCFMIRDINKRGAV